jgi:DsbC/DsbD-like thiol-disulfide interchange protein
MTLPVPFRAAALAVAAACLIAGSARADDASPWIKDTYSQVRLIAGSRSGTAFLGGIALQLQPGWKTYWRTPGDSGVPPRFDFSKSENVESVTILWPAPMRFPDGAGGVSLGYSKQVLLPLRIVAKHADKPVTLRAAINYAVCDKLCVPVEASAELTFTSVASTEDSAIAAALDTVPKPARIGDATPLAIRDVRREGANTVVVDVVAPREAGGKEVDLFVEGPTPDWALPVPKLVKREANGLRRFSFNLEGLPPGASATGAVLKFTLTGPSAAYEYTVALP